MSANEVQRIERFANYSFTTILIPAQFRISKPGESKLALFAAFIMQLAFNTLASSTCSTCSIFPPLFSAMP